MNKREKFSAVILHIRHKGLREFWEKSSARRVNPDWLARIDRILNALDLAQVPADVDLPGFRLHMLKGDYKGFYSVDVSGNWRIVSDLKALTPLTLIWLITTD